MKPAPAPELSSACLQQGAAPPEFKQLARVLAAGRLGGEVEQEKRKGGTPQNARQGTRQQYRMHSKGSRHCLGHRRDLRRLAQAVRPGGKLQQLLRELLRSGNPGGTQRGWCLSMCQAHGGAHQMAQASAPCPRTSPKLHIPLPEPPGGGCLEGLHPQLL